MARVVQFKQVFDPPLSKREARRASDTRQRILDAADQLFGQHGYRATSMRPLTEAAGVSLAAVNSRPVAALVAFVAAGFAGTVRRA